MNDGKSRKKVSLKSVMNKHLILGMLGITVLTMVLEMVLIIIPCMGLYKRELKHEGAMIMALIGEDRVLELIGNAKEIYYNTPEEIRRDQFSDEYREIILSSLGEDYGKKRELVASCGKKAELLSVYFTFYDEENHRAVMAINGLYENGELLPGQWLPDENGRIMSSVLSTRNSDWNMTVFHNEEHGWVAIDFEEIRDHDQNLVGCISTAVKIDALERAIVGFLLLYIPLMVIIIILRTVLDARWTKKRVIGPIKELTEGARQYQESRGLDENGRYLSVFRDLEVKTGDEFEELGNTMADMEAKIEASMITIKEETAAKERLATELDLAKEIQRGALPVDFDSVTEETGFTLFASMEPAKSVGGDFYDFFRIDEGHVGLVIADVSGKGVPASLFMMISKALLKNTAIKGGRPSEILQTVNNSLCADNPNAMFVTVWFGILDTATGEVLAANAGHEFPFLTGEDKKFFMYEEPHGIALGCMEGMEYEDYTFTIPKGGMLFVYTDGVAEAHNEKDELFDTERIEETLNTCCAQAPREVIDVMRKALNEFRGTRDQFDDITMLAIKNQ